MAVLLLLAGYVAMFVDDGTVPTYLGDAQMTIRVVDDAREASPVVTVEATGRGEGVSFELTARCQTMVRG